MRSKFFAVRVVVVVCLAGLLTGCFMQHNIHLPPMKMKADSSTLAKSSTPTAIKLDFKYQIQGKSNRNGRKYLQPRLVDALNGSGVVTVVDGGDAPTLKVLYNATADKGDVNEKLVAWGFVGGVAGQAVAERHIITVEFNSAPGATKRRFLYEFNQNVVATIGPHGEIAGLTKMETADALEAVLKNYVFVAIKELQSEGAFK